MGYSHYFTVGTKTSKKDISSFVEMGQRFINESKIEAEIEAFDKKEVFINGEGETFCFDYNSGNRHFCKTRRQQYDPIVGGLLLIGKYFNVISKLDSDGFGGGEENYNLDDEWFNILDIIYKVGNDKLTDYSMNYLVNHMSVEQSRSLKLEGVC